VAKPRFGTDLVAYTGKGARARGTVYSLGEANLVRTSHGELYEA